MLFIIIITVYLTVLSLSKNETLNKWVGIGCGVVIIGFYLYGLYMYIVDFNIDEFRKDLIMAGIYIFLPALAFFIVRQIKRKLSKNHKGNS